MKVAVWDTYVKQQDGSVLHFDIVVKDNIKDPEVIYGYGKKYLASKGSGSAPLSVKECQFCHIEEPGDEMKVAIESQGYFIIEMEQVPAELPVNANRRDMILHLRAHFEQYRFADFKGKGEEEVRSILAKVKQNQKSSI